MTCSRPPWGTTHQKDLREKITFENGQKPTFIYSVNQSTAVGITESKSRMPALCTNHIISCHIFILFIIISLVIEQEEKGRLS